MNMVAMQLTDKFYNDANNVDVRRSKDFHTRDNTIPYEYCDHYSDIFDEYVTDGRMRYGFQNSNKIIFDVYLPAMKYKHTVRIEYQFDARTGNYIGRNRSCKRELSELEQWQCRILADTYFGILEKRGYITREFKDA